MLHNCPTSIQKELTQIKQTLLANCVVRTFVSSLVQTVVIAFLFWCAKSPLLL